MKYVDGYVLVVPKRKVKEYQKLASEAGRFWKKHGALDYVECIGDDLNPDVGGEKILTFPKLAKLKKGETVWLSFVTYKSKKHRDSVNKKVAKEYEKKYKDNPNQKMPFDVKRMAFGGFKVAVKK